MTAPVTSLRVLVVDDSRDARDSLALLLRRWGHEIRVAPDGPSALEAFREFRPQAVVLDIGLPAMDGYEVAREIRRTEGPPSAFLVALTGWGQEQDRERSREAGFDAHLTKPADPLELKRLLAAHRPVPGRV